MMDIEQMRQYIKNAYPGTYGWENKVNQMSEGEIIGLYRIILETEGTKNGQNQEQDRTNQAEEQDHSE